MNENFVKALYESIVEENKKLYNELYETTNINNVTSEYWKKGLTLYNSLSDENKVILLSIIEQTMIDTISNLLGVIDGSSTLESSESEPKLLLDNKDTDGELQDSFLEFIESLEKN